MESHAMHDEIVDNPNDRFRLGGER
jgi:hypothetical protein